ncbi:hypothetical protein DMA11_04805 [Marinilabiliaceae bacterium JC017]|nr:hypothetical protein DMA11_04805 [Marinilabiliaceae bacterium JC017]
MFFLFLSPSMPKIYHLKKKMHSVIGLHIEEETKLFWNLLPIITYPSTKKEHLTHTLILKEGR